jgi:hypothetical protein
MAILQFSGSESCALGPAGIGSVPAGTLNGVTCTPGATIMDNGAGDAIGVFADNGLSRATLGSGCAGVGGVSGAARGVGAALYTAAGAARGGAGSGAIVVVAAHQVAAATMPSGSAVTTASRLGRCHQARSSR